MENMKQISFFLHSTENMNEISLTDTLVDVFTNTNIPTHMCAPKIILISLLQRTNWKLQYSLIISSVENQKGYGIIRIARESIKTTLELPGPLPKVSLVPRS